MGEIRKDYFTERYVIISPERARRPHDFKQHPMDPVVDTPFTPGNESKLPGILAEYPPGNEWRFRVVPNKFAIVRPQGAQQFSTDKIFTWMNNYGYHEVVIEGQKDGMPFAHLGKELISEAISVGVERVSKLMRKPDVAYVLYFKNERPEAGASINHPHSQIVTTSIVPYDVQEQHKNHKQLRAQFGFSPLYKILDFERGGPRIIKETQHFVSLCPYASRYASEVMIIPLRDSHSYVTMSGEERNDLAEHLHNILGKLASISAPFNVEWHHSHEDNGFHWHVCVTPRFNVWGGLEIGAGIIVNPTPPEDAAAFYRT